MQKQTLPKVRTSYCRSSDRYDVLCRVHSAIASSSASETQSNAAALVQATHKIQVLDSECAQYKAQNTLLQRELDMRNAEVNKLKGSLSHSGDRLTTTDAETRRIKAQSQVALVYQ